MRTLIVICLASALLGLANRAAAEPPKKKVLDLIKDLKDRDPKNRAFAADELGGKLLVPVVLFQCDHRTFRSLQHGAVTSFSWTFFEGRSDIEYGAKKKKEVRIKAA